MDRDFARARSKPPQLTQKQSTLLDEIFRELLEHPTGVDAPRFKARHDDDLDDIQALTEAGLLRRRDNRFVIPLVGVAAVADVNTHAHDLLKLCSQLFAALRQYFKEHQGAKITIPQLAEKAGVSESDVRRGVEHMLDLMIWGGRTNDLSAPDAYVMAGEHILDYETFGVPRISRTR